MRTLYIALATVVLALGAATAPAFAHDSRTLRSITVDGGHDVYVAVAAGMPTEPRIVSSVPAEMPSFEQRAHIGGVAEIVIDLDKTGKLSRAFVLRSSGHVRLDESALRAVRASTYQPETIDGQGIGGRYMVEVEVEPAF